VDIPSVLEGYIRDGKAVLLLGAGASLGAKNARGETPPDGRNLADLLSDRFLGGKYKTLGLSQIGEYAISEADLITVQEYIRELLDGFEPTDAHRFLPEFNWWGIATTNYDRLIERAYQTATTPLQNPRALIENGDRIEDYLRDPDSVLLLKLHGCVTRTNNAKCPLILTTDQYITHRAGRSRIFDHLSAWAHERPLIFIGHGLQDSDIRTLLLDLTTSIDSRPRYYAVLPGVDEVQRRYWETKRVTLLDGTFDDFMRTLDARVPTPRLPQRASALRSPSPISTKLVRPDITVSSISSQFLTIDTEYVAAVSATRTADPHLFYKGANPGWPAIEQELDIRRYLGDTILTDHFLSEESEHRGSPEVILVKGHAGAGTSVLLRRIAWDAARDYNRLVLYLKPNGIINTTALQEIINVTAERVYFFVDDAPQRLRELQALFTQIGPEGRRLTVILGSRINEWNIYCSDLTSWVTFDHELRYLGIQEIDALIAKLAQHDALGTLTDASPERRRAAFADRAGRQLLVALHEATLSTPFEEIIENEFKNITPGEAQRIYLSICVLNRLSVPVRAGLIARVHGVPFEDFKARLFAPLEQVVTAEYDTIIRDYLYSARHPHIAEIVFQRVLRTQEDRHDAYLRCLRELNIDYSADNKAFRQMVRGRAVLDLFPNHDLARDVYRVARSIAGEEPHLLHQMALYEMHRPNGNLEEAANLLNEATQLAPRDLAIKHSIAEHKLRCAETARTPLERDKLLKEAVEIATRLRATRSHHTFGHSTLVKIGIRRLDDLLSSSGASESDIEHCVKDIENNLSDGLQRLPGDSYLLEAESTLARLLNDSARALRALEKAFAANPRSAFLAIRLSVHHRQSGSVPKAKEVLEKALEANPSEKKLHFEYAKLLMTMTGISGDDLAYHLKRSFVPGDANYLAQMLYGRQLFINGSLEDSRAIFRAMEGAHVGADLRDGLLYPLDQVFRGSLVRLEASYCFIARDGLRDWIFAHRRDIDDSLWRRLSPGSRVILKIGFSMRGARAFDVREEI